MSYDEKFRRRTLEYRQKGHSLAQTSEVFNVAINTIRNKEHPDAYLRKIAEAFKCCQTAIRKALKRLKITRKKRPRVIIVKTPKN